MVDIEKLKALANEAIADECWEPQLGLTSSETAFAKEASPGVVLELIAENERFKAERDQLRAEVEALRKDAERYRWLKECEPEEIDIDIENPRDDLDAAIDAAMAAKEVE